MWRLVILTGWREFFAKSFSPLRRAEGIWQKTKGPSAYHIDSKLDHGFVTTKLAADFLVWGQLNVITISMAQMILATRQRSYMQSNG